VAENRSRLSPTTVVWRYPVGNRNLGTRLVSFLENWSDWTIELPDLTPYPSVTDRRTDRRVCYIDIAFCIHKRMRFDRRAIKTRMTIAKEAGIWRREVTWKKKTVALVDNSSFDIAAGPSTWSCKRRSKRGYGVMQCWLPIGCSDYRACAAAWEMRSTAQRGGAADSNRCSCGPSLMIDVLRYLAILFVYAHR